MTDYTKLQSRCQRGETSLAGASNLLAECYGALGKLMAENERLSTDLSSLWETVNNTIAKLGVDCVAAQSAPGKPSDVLASYANQLRDENERLRKSLTYIRDTSDDWHVCEKAADALADASKGNGEQP